MTRVPQRSLAMVTKEQFGEWRQHPATKFFFEFLNNRKNLLTSYCMEGWLKGLKEFQADGEVDRGRILELMEVCDITHQVIETFYKELENDSENPEDGTR